MKNKSYNFRIYPNKIQRELLLKTFGSNRFIYNQMLNERIETYSKLKDDKQELYSYDYKTEKDYKLEFNWLKEVDSISLQQSRLNLIQAYKNFFKRIKQGTGIGFPKFKNKYSKQSYRTVNVNNNLKVDFENKKVKLPKLGWINYNDDRLFNVPIKSITISKTKAGNYYCSILVLETIISKDKKSNVIGIDLGIDTYATLSNGTKIENPKHFHKSQNKLRKEQQKLSRKKLNSNNRNKQRIQVARVHEKIRNQKKDFLQQLSTKLINENQVIILENLSITKMLKTKYLAKSIQQSNWNEFVNMLKYKADWYNRELIQVDKYFPSSQLCSNCNHQNKELTLKDRNWQCPKCKTRHDRDINAAINLKNTVGTTEINACEDMNVAIADSVQESTSFRSW